MTETAPLPRQYIEIKPGFSGGKPHIAGRRVKVRDVAFWHERQGLSVDDIASQYGLGLPEIYAALSYYFDHREQIDQDLRDKDEYVARTAASVPSVPEERLKRRRGG